MFCLLRTLSASEYRDPSHSIVTKLIMRENVIGLVSLAICFQHLDCSYETYSCSIAHDAVLALDRINSQSLLDAPSIPLQLCSSTLKVTGSLEAF